MIASSGTFWGLHISILKAVVNDKFTLGEVAGFVRVGPHLLFFHNVDIIEDIRVHVEEGEGSAGIVGNVLLLCSELHHNSFLWDSSLLKPRVISNLCR